MKRKLINSFLILSVSSAISKIFSIANRMMLSRLISQEAMTLYLLIIPTLSLCITLGQFGIPSAVFRLVSHPKYNRFKVVISAFILSVFTVSIICLTLLFSSHYIAYHLLKNSLAFYPILSLILFIPLVSISGIIKSFYLGKGHLYIIAKAQIIEEVSRLLFTYFILVRPLSYDLVFTVTVIYLSMSIGELTSIIYMLVKLKEKYSCPYPITYEKSLSREILNISLPLTGSRLYHCFVNFLEPVTLIFVLTSLGFNQHTIHHQYAIMSGYVVSLLVTPTFFTTVIYRLYLPIAQKDLYYKKHSTLKHLYLALFCSFLISIPFTCAFYFFPKTCLSIIYNTTQGYRELKYMCIPFTLFYLQTPFSVILHAQNKNKEMFIISLLECTLEIILTYLLSYVYYTHSVLVSLLFGLLLTLLISGFLCFFSLKKLDCF